MNKAIFIYNEIRRLRKEPPVNFLLLAKLEFGGESTLTMRARYSALRYCPDPLGIVTAEQFDKLELSISSY